MGRTHPGTDSRLLTGLSLVLFVLLVLLVVVAVPSVLAGCAKTDGNGKIAASDDAPRIVSLSPAISRTLVDLGLADRIVGRSNYCESLPPEIPVVGDLMNVDYEQLIRLEPTHLLVQPPRRGLDPRLEKRAAESGWTIGAWTGIDRIDDIERLVRELPEVLYQMQPHERDRVAERAATLLNEMATALAPGRDAGWRGPTLLVSQVDPVIVFGHETYLHEVLVRLGATNACRAEGWVPLSLEDVTRLDPGAIILVRPEASADLDALVLAGPLGRLEIAAARDGRIALLGHPDALLPSSGIIGVAAELGRVLRSLAGESEPPS